MDHSASEPLQALVVQFIAELVQQTADLPTDDAHREA